MMTMAEPILSAQQLERIEKLEPALTARLLAHGEGVLEKFPLHDYVADLDAIEATRNYNFVSESIEDRCELIVRQYGAPALDAYHRCLLVALISECEQRAQRKRIPGSVRQLMRCDFDRILGAVQCAPPGFHGFHNPLFVKDLALCRQKLLPCGSEAAELSGGIPRRTLFLGGALQLFKAGWFVLAHLGGFSPLYESHWDRRLARQFTEEDYNLCYLRFAELLELNADVRGMFGSSWWFDPMVRTIAPELEFLRRIPEANGAHVFRVGQKAGAIRDATSFSRRRRELYEKGAYHPERYMLVWARDDLLHWARRFRTQGAEPVAH